MNDQQMLEASENAVKAAGDYCKKFGIVAGLTGKQHAGAITHALIDAGLIDESRKLEAFAIVNALENGSALRQKLEAAGNLGKAVTVAASYI